MGPNGRSSNAHNFLISRRNALKFSPFVDGLLVLQTDARVGMMKIVVPETGRRVKLRGGGLPHPDNSVSKHCCGRVHMAIPAPLLAPIRVQNLKAIRALESAYNRYPHLPWALWKTGNIIIAVRGARAQ